MRPHSLCFTIVAGVLGLGFIANGLFMLAAPYDWYLAVPGVPDTGPPNRHFIGDIGGAYLASGIGLLAGLRWSMLMPGAVLATALFHGFHGLVHVMDGLAGRCTPIQLQFDPIAVGVPAILLILMAVSVVRGRG